MNGYQHLCVGASAAMLAVSAVTAHDMMPQMAMSEGLLYTGCYGLGLLLPDIDNPNSLAGQYFYLPVGHRTITHTLYAVMPFLILGLFLKPLLFLAAGYFLHLLADSASRCGVAWLHPYTGYHIYPSGAKFKKGFHLVLYGGKKSAWAFCCIFAVLCLIAGHAIRIL